jgi:hypothetical protein
MDPDDASMRPTQMAVSLQWVSFGLILVFLAQVVAALYPVALFKPEWMVRVSDSIRATASLPIMALALIMLANMINKKVLPTSLHLQTIRRISSLVAICFVLLIPLQTYGTLAGIRSQLQQGQTQLIILSSASDKVQKATTEDQLRNAIRTIPGGEELALRPLGAEVETIKPALLERLRETTNRLQTQLSEAQSKAMYSAIPALFRDAIVALGYAIGFGSMGYSQPGQPSPIIRLFKGANSQPRKEQGSTSKPAYNRRAKRSPKWLMRLIGR